MYCCSCSSGFLYIVKQGDGDLSLSQKSKLTQTDAIVHPPTITTTTTPQSNTHKITILFNFVLTKEKCSIMKKGAWIFGIGSFGIRIRLVWLFILCSAIHCIPPPKFSNTLFKLTPWIFMTGGPIEHRAQLFLCSLCLCLCLFCLCPPKVSRSKKEVWHGVRDVGWMCEREGNK